MARLGALWLVGLCLGGYGLGVGAVARADDGSWLRRLGEGKHLERTAGDVAGADRVYTALWQSLPADHPLRAEVCFRLVMVRLRYGAPDDAVRRATEPFRELKDRHKRPDLVARAEALLEGTIAWSLPGPSGVTTAARVRAVTPDGRSVAFDVSRQGGVELGQRVHVLRAGVPVARGLVERVGLELAAATLVEGEAREGDDVHLESAAGPGPRPPEDDAAASPRGAPAERGVLAEAQRFLQGLMGDPARLAPARGDSAARDAAVSFDVRVVVADVRVIAEAGLRFAPLQPEVGAAIDPHEGGAGGLVALVGAEDVERMLASLDDGGAPGGALIVVRRAERLVAPRDGTIGERAIGTWRLPVGEPGPRFEGVVLRVRCPPQALDEPDGAVPSVELEAIAIDLPQVSHQLEDDVGLVRYLVPSRQRVHGVQALPADVGALVLAGLGDPFGVPLSGGGARALLVVLVRR